MRFHLLGTTYLTPSLFLGGGEENCSPGEEGNICTHHIKDDSYYSLWASQVVLVVKNLPANGGDTRDVQSLDGEDPLEEGMAIHSGILAWRIPWTEEPVRLQSIGSHKVRHD